MDESRESFLLVAKAAARSAAEVLLRHYGDARVSHKGDESYNLVTQADIQAESIIVKHIHKEYPEHELLLEEGQSTGCAASEHLWIVDPLDGTTNYVHGVPHFSTSIAYASGGVVRVGVVYDPMRDEMWTAVRGQGAYLNEGPIHVSNHSQMTEAIVSTGFYYDRGQMMQQTLFSIQKLFEHNVRGIRRFGGAALDQCWVACGRFDAFFEYQLSPWDYAAGSLIVEEAGGRTADRTGRPLHIDSGHLIVSNDHLFSRVCEIVSWRA